MRVKHPETIDGVGGHPPHSVTLNGTIYPLDGGEADIPERDVEALADLYGVDLADIRVDGGDGVSAPLDNTADDKSDRLLIEEGECPWCSDYDGDHVRQHASSAHPDIWEDYKE